MKTSMISGVTKGNATLTTVQEIVGDALIKSGWAIKLTIDHTVLK